MADTKPGVKELWGTIKKSPALLITVLVGAGLILYLLVKKGPSGQKTDTSGQTTLPTMTGQGSYIQPYIEPIIIPMWGSSGATNGASPPPATGVTMPPPTGGGSPAGANATTPHQDYAYTGLLGPNAQVDFRNRTYTNAQGQQVPIPIPNNDQLVQGSQNRVWYTDTGGQHLLTSGVGPAIDARTNTPATTTTTQNSSSTGSTNQQNSSTQTTRNTATIPAN